jgi:hypothetical protein
MMPIQGCTDARIADLVENRFYTFQLIYETKSPQIHHTKNSCHLCHSWKKKTPVLHVLSGLYSKTLNNVLPLNPIKNEKNKRVKENRNLPLKKFTRNSRTFYGLPSRAYSLYNPRFQNQSPGRYRN